MIIAGWLYIVLFTYPSGEVERFQGVFETLADCQGERQRAFIQALQIDPLIRVDSRCTPILKEKAEK